MKVVLYNEHWNGFWSLPSHVVDHLRLKFPDVAFIHARKESDIVHTIADAEIYFGYRLQKSDADTAKKLKWVHVPAASVQQLVGLALEERGIIVTNSKGIHAGPISEHVLGCMLVFSRKFLDSWKFQQKRQYAARELLNEPPFPEELRGKTVVILGLGSIGLQLARLCKAFGMRILGVKRTVDGNHDFVDQVFMAGEYRKPLAEADFIVIAVPQTKETEGLIGEEEISLLKKSCVLINVARGSVVVQAALVRALKEKRILGAALDVFDQEPLPSDSELFSLPNVFLTPHTSGVSGSEHWPRMEQLFAENLHRFIAGKPLLNVVDLKRGY
jgi:phosphoglycerate dehydrogenase-like enzyme